MDALASRYGELEVPVAILFGKDDQILSPELHGARTIAMAPGATLNLIDGGHMIPVTTASVVAE